MKTEKVISIILAFSGLFSAFYLSKGVMKSTPQIIAKQSITYLSYNKNILSNLTHQKSDYHTGFGLIFFVFIIQILNLIFFPIIINPSLNYTFGIIITIIAIIIILILSCTINKCLFRKYLKQSRKALIVEKLNYLFNDMLKNFYSAKHFFGTLEYGKIFFNFVQEDNESNYDYLLRYCNSFNYKPADNLDIDRINNYKKNTK